MLVFRFFYEIANGTWFYRVIEKTTLFKLNPNTFPPIFVNKVFFSNELVQPNKNLTAEI